MNINIKQPTYSAIEAIYSGEKAPRKMKKLVLGRKINKSNIRKKISKIVPDTEGIVDEDFCSECGCIYQRGTGNMAEYPEHWEYFYCIRCGNKVGSIDNSRYVSSLESKV